MAFLDRIPYLALIIVAVFLALAPFQPEPHLVQKWRMFTAGTLRKPIDIFDVIFHLTPALLLAAKVVRDVLGKGA